MKPNRFGRGDQARGPELDAERREHRVAGHREGQFQRAAAFLAFGVAELDAIEGRVGRVGEIGMAVGDPGRSTPVTVTILNVDPGGWTLSSPMPETAEDLTAGGLQHDDPAELGAERGHRGRWTAGEIVVRTPEPRRRRGCEHAGRATRL